MCWYRLSVSKRMADSMDPLNISENEAMACLVRWLQQSDFTAFRNGDGFQFANGNKLPEDNFHGKWLPSGNQIRSSTLGFPSHVELPDGKFVEYPMKTHHVYWFNSWNHVKPPFLLVKSWIELKKSLLHPPSAARPLGPLGDLAAFSGAPAQPAPAPPGWLPSSCRGRKDGVQPVAPVKISTWHAWNAGPLL